MCLLSEKERKGKMGWFYPKRRGPEQKQGWTGQTMATVSPTLHLLMIFGIVISLLWLSHYTDYKAQPHHAAINFQLFLLLSPILLIFFMISYSTRGSLNFRHTCSKHESLQRAGLSPRNVAIMLLLLVLLLLLSYQSSFHSKWFGPLWRLD